MRVTVDTNILISATFWYGSSNKILELVENNKIDLILSKDIFKEYIEVLNYKEIQDKIKNKNLEIKYSTQKILSLSTIIEPKIKIDIIKEDQADNKILECAKEGKVNYIISQDKHLLKLKKFENIKIIKPEDFLKFI